MELYRVISDNIINDTSDGINTFTYNDGIKYLHFFILPESAEIFQLLKYTNMDIDSVVLKCDIPYNIIKDNFGVGMYRYYGSKTNPNTRNPFLEVRIKESDFDESMIKERSTHVLDAWKNATIYKRYLLHCVYERNCFINMSTPTQLQVKLNENFSFLHYFPKDSLLKEGIICDDYPENDTFNEAYMKDPYFKALLNIKDQENKKNYLIEAKRKLQELISNINSSNNKKL